MGSAMAQGESEAGRRVLNIYETGTSYLHPNRDSAAAVAGRQRIACIPISFTLGEGLDTPEDSDDD